MATKRNTDYTDYDGLGACCRTQVAIVCLSILFA